MGHRRRHDRRRCARGRRGDRPSRRVRTSASAGATTSDAAVLDSRVERDAPDRRDCRRPRQPPGARLRIRHRVLRRPRRRDRRRGLGARHGVPGRRGRGVGGRGRARPCRRAPHRAPASGDRALEGRRSARPDVAAVQARYGRTGRQRSPVVELGLARRCRCRLSLRARAAARRPRQRGRAGRRHESGVRQGSRPCPAPAGDLPAAGRGREGRLRADGRGDAARAASAWRRRGSRPPASRLGSPTSTRASRARSPAERSRYPRDT